MSSLQLSRKGIQEHACVQDVIVNKVKAKMAKKEKGQVKGRKMPEMYSLTQSGTSYLKLPVEETF